MNEWNERKGEEKRDDKIIQKQGEKKMSIEHLPPNR